MHYADSNVPSEIAETYIREYQTRHRHPKAKPIQITPLLAVEDALVEGSGRPGVYLIFKADKTLVYIGMASSNIAQRISMHLRAKEQESGFWLNRKPVFCQLAIVQETWEPHSLEEYLVQRAKGYVAEPSAA